MKCPVCATTALVISERQGIEIDYCPQCRGVWLDRGELDKLIERSAAQAAAPAPQAVRQAVPPPVHQHQQHQQYQQQSNDFGHHRRDQYQGRDHDYRARKKKGFLGEIFDFD
ncbi:zf-TFIIB domain-containing protein [Herbaspirillum lusitanum]|uniref:Zf-TFIIB domain-containing protein n=1 Tax=Herbaspirillum lusitanum TaxID=213312 RepID=A0ABW9AEM5_9BURK